MTKNHRISICLSQILLVVLGCTTINATVLAQEIDDAVGDYEIFMTNNAANHEGARLLIMRTARGSGSDPDTYGLAWVSNRSGGAGNGLACTEALVLPGNKALSCSNEVRNPAGKIIHVESLVVGITGSAYCEAIRNSLPDSQKDNVVDTMDDSCDDSDTEQCICYDIGHRGTNQASPPSQGTGSGRRG